MCGIYQLKNLHVLPYLCSFYINTFVHNSVFKTYCLSLKGAPKLYKLQAHSTGSTSDCCPAHPHLQTLSYRWRLYLSPLSVSITLQKCIIFRALWALLCLNCLSSSSLYFLLWSSRENLFAFCIPLESWCMFLGSARNGRWYVFSFYPHFWTISTSRRGRMLTYATIFTREVHFCHFKHFFLF